MDVNGNDSDTEFKLPAQHVASLDEVEEPHRCLYIKEGNGFVLRPHVAADFDRMASEYRLAELEHESNALRLTNQILAERCQRLEREAASAAGRPTTQPKPADPENSFAVQLARLKSAIMH